MRLTVAQSKWFKGCLTGSSAQPDTHGQRQKNKARPLGHVDIATTEIYARADTELKRKAQENAYPDMIPTDLPQWSKDEDLLNWLTSL